MDTQLDQIQYTVIKIMPIVIKITTHLSFFIHQHLINFSSVAKSYTLSMHSFTFGTTACLHGFFVCVRLSF